MSESKNGGGRVGAVGFQIYKKESSDCSYEEEADESMQYDPNKGWMFKHELNLPCSCSCCRSIEAE